MIWIILIAILLFIVIGVSGGKETNLNIPAIDLKNIEKDLKKVIFTNDIKNMGVGEKITIKGDKKKIQKKIKGITFYSNLPEFVEDIDPIKFDKTKSRDEILDEVIDNINVKKGFYAVSLE